MDGERLAPTNSKEKHVENNRYKYNGVKLIALKSL
jgi:hypothetical protein